MKEKKLILKSLIWALTVSLMPTSVNAKTNVELAAEGPTGTIYYVDSEEGNDENSGMSEEQAFKTLAKVNRIELNAGDAIYLKNGSEFNEQFKPRGKGTEENPIIITNYGDKNSNIPVINGGGKIYDNAANNTSAAVLIENMQYVNVSNLEVTNDDIFNLTDLNTDPNNMRGTNQRRIGIHITINEDAETFTKGQRVWSGINVNNCYVHDVDGDEQRNTNKVNGGIGVEVFYRNVNKVYPYFDGVTLEENTIEKVDRTGIKGIRLTELSYEDSKGDDGNRYNAVRNKEHNQAGRNFVVRNNDLKNIGGDGILIDSTIKTVVEYNVLFDHTKRSTMANAGIWCWNTQDVLFQYNESYGGPIYNQDGCSYDCDYFSSGTIFQYNYSHDTPMGFMLLMGGNEMDIVRYNISQNDGVAWRHFSGNSTTKSYIYNNVFYYDGANWKWSLSDDLKDNYEFNNNIFYNYNNTIPTSWGDEMDWSKAIFETNAVYEASGKIGTNEIPNVLHNDPKFVNAGSGETKIWDSLKGYQLSNDSPLINKGTFVNFDMSGASYLDSRDYYTAKKDFYGNPLYVGTPDIGVHESSFNVSNDLSLEENGTYRITTADGVKFIQIVDTDIDLNDKEGDNQQFVLIKSQDGYKIKLLNSGLDTLYLSIVDGKLQVSEMATVWQIDDLKNGLVKIKNDTNVLTYESNDVSIVADGNENQRWYLKLEEKSKSFNCGGSSVEGYSQDQYYNESTHTSGRYGSVTEISDGIQHTDIFTTAVTGEKFGYKFPVSKGSYNIKLNFNEIENITGRTFNILINGEIYKEAFTLDESNMVEEIGGVYSKNGYIDVQLTAAYNKDGVKTKALLSGISVELAANSNTVLNINCGSTGIDGLNNDLPFPTNGSGYYGESASINFGKEGRPSLDGGMPTVMETGREGNQFGYKFKLQPGNYRLKCLFNEGIKDAEIGDRVFDIYVNEKLLVSDFDIVKEAGAIQGVDVTRFVKSENGVLDVKFVGKNGTKALVNAIIVDLVDKEETRENILINKTATCSTQEGSLGANYAVDGSQASRWGSGFSNNQWLQVDMGDTYLLDTVLIDWTYGAYATKYKVEISNDGTKWETVKYVTDAQPGLNYISFEPAQGRYLRVFGETRNDVWGMSFTELEAYGTKVTGEAEIESRVESKDSIYTSTLSAKNIYQRYTTMTVKLSYDATQLIYVGNEQYLNPNLKFVEKKVDEKKGEITYVFELIKSTAFDEVSEFVKFDFEAKGSRSVIKVDTVFSNAAAHLTELPELQVFVPNTVSENELKVLINTAKEVLSSAEEGRLPGQYRKENIEKFQSVIDKVQSTLNQHLESEYIKEYTKLETVIDDFKKSAIKHQYNHYYRNYRGDDDVNYGLNNSTALIENGKLHIGLKGNGATATDNSAPKLNSGTFIVKFDIDSLKDQIRFDIKNTETSRIEIGYEKGSWFWGGALDGGWGSFPNIEDDVLYIDRTNEVFISFEKLENSNTKVTLVVNGNTVGTIEQKFSDDSGSYRFWTRYTEKNINIHEVTYTNAPIYHINVMNTENGMISEKGSVQVYGETNKTFIFTPNAGYEVDKVLVDGNEVVIKDNQYTFEFIESNHNLEVIFKKISEKANYDKVDDAIERANTLIKENYLDFSEVDNAIKAVIRNLEIIKQAEVDAMAKAIEDAINTLVLKSANYSDVDKAIAAAEKIDSNQYTKESLAQLDKAIRAVIRNLDITKQAEVDAMAKVINDALKGLDKSNDAPLIEAKPSEPIQPDESLKLEQSTMSQQPKTDDDSSIALYAIMSMVVLVIGLAILRKKENQINC